MIKYTLSAIILATLVGGINLNAAEEGLPAGTTMKECLVTMKPNGATYKACFESGKAPKGMKDAKKEVCFFKAMPDGSEVTECAAVQK